MTVQPHKSGATKWQLLLTALGILLATAVPIYLNYKHAQFQDGQNAQIIIDMQRSIQEIQNYRIQDQVGNKEVDVRLDQLQLDAAILKQRFDDFKK